MQLVRDVDVKTKNETKKKERKITWKNIKKQWVLIAMSFPFVVWVIIFKYLPLFGWTMAFQNYKPQLSFFEQEWVGFKHFIDLFKEPLFYESLKNTLGMSILGLVFGTASAIIFALLLNELRYTKFKKFVQTISYLPHFISWVVAATIVTNLLANAGIVNEILLKLNLISEPIKFLSSTSMFWGIVTASDIWKEMGWNAIIYLAAMTAIDPELYDAAKVDGAGRIRRMFSITLPLIKSTILVLLIMSIGNILNIGFEKQMLLGNKVVETKALVIDKYALDYGIGMFRYSFGTAIGIFKSVVGIILIFLANKASKKFNDGEGGLLK
ncbi:ABC transporter permease subunit [Clostridium sp. DSM 100503]|uniref:ABC transporter permease n=1 Tax=Clostridium sp. DSM 100503 TaxID=2963282 RepID=UPI00214A3308|nr:ABC transporter permease subunit [Clostridium sp. DSM 100503]MCR1950655.1 ABC transporter permease subunit [Clostridium sp. DSM 100503]